MNKMPFDDIYSHHPDKGGDTLSAHLESVGTLASEYVGMDVKGPDGTPTIILASVCGRCHDLGKATTWFQRHLDDQSVPRSLSQHSPLGALAAYHCMRAIGSSHEDAFIGLVAVAKHHGTLPDVASYIKRNIIDDEHRHEVLERQIADIDARPGAHEVVDNALDAATDGSLSWGDFQQKIRSEAIYDDLSRHALRGPVVNHTACSSTFYEAVLTVWGALVKADKTDAATLPIDEDSITLPAGAVEEYIDTFETVKSGSLEKTLNDRREDARESILENISQIETDGGVGTITLPTGLGKTLSSLAGATRLVAREGREDGRIIYALPFTSIVDQTADEVSNVFNAAGVLEDQAPITPYGWALTVDHHLESTATRIQNAESDSRSGQELENDEDTDSFADEELLLGKMWGSGVVVTTYVQLFESLVRPSNSQSLKLPNLQDSVIVLDEPQTLPLDWWPVARRVVNMLTETFDATILSMSATQPHLFTADDAFDDEIAFNAPELVDDPSSYFKSFHRTDYHLHGSVQRFLDSGVSSEPLDHTTAANTLVQDTCSTASSALAICNTISSARELSDEVSKELRAHGRTEIPVGEVFDDLLQKVNEPTEVSPEELKKAIRDCRSEDSIITLHLTARHRPNDRRLILDAVEDLATDDIPFVFVATQLVEAGVDVSFRRVYRDLAPMPSLVQAAGRCNRSFEWERDLGDVTIWRLGTTKGNSLEPSRLVYARGDGYNLLDVTRTALNAVNTEAGDRIPDMDIAEKGVETYYDTLVRRRPGNQAFVRYLNEGLFRTVREEARYIDERDTVEVVVCRVENDRDLVDTYLEAADEDDYEEMRRIQAELSERAVSIPRREYSEASIDEVLSVTQDGEPAMASVSSENGWFSSRFGAAARGVSSTPRE